MEARQSRGLNGTLKPPDPLPPPGGVVGDNTPPTQRREPNEPRDPGLAGSNPLGDGEGLDRENYGVLAGADEALDINVVVERFQRAKQAKLKPDTMEAYVWEFKRFSNQVGLAAYTKRQLAGKRAKGLILDHLNTLQRSSWRWTLAALRSVWVPGLGLPWPIEAREDIGRLPRVRRGTTPPDEIVGKWTRALAHEPDPYLRLLWFLVAQHGWRPSHVKALRWSNVVYDGGKAVSIIAYGEGCEFKTFAPVAARLAPDVGKALEDWRRMHPGPVPEARILPWRSHGNTMAGVALGKDMLSRAWEGLRRRWDLPKLRPKDLRHWVASACRRAGLSKPATAYLMGHDASAGGGMGDWYDNPEIGAALVEQENCLPRGPLGILEPPEVRLLGGFPPDALECLRAYLGGGMGTLEFANRMEGMRTRQEAVKVGV